MHSLLANIDAATPVHGDICHLPFADVRFDLAYRLFLDPINLHTHWYVLLLPLALFMSIAYKSVRVSELKHLPRAVGVMTIQVCFWMAVLGLAGYLFVQHLAPLIAPK